MNEQTKDQAVGSLRHQETPPLFGLHFPHYKIMVITLNSEKRDRIQSEGSLYRDLKHQSGFAEHQILEASERAAGGVLRKWASGVGPWEPRVGSPLTWEATSSKPSMSAPADKEKPGPLVTFLSPSSTNVFTWVLLDLKLHVDPRTTKTF